MIKVESHRAPKERRLRCPGAFLWCHSMMPGAEIFEMLSACYDLKNTLSAIRELCLILLMLYIAEILCRHRYVQEEDNMIPKRMASRSKHRF